MVRRCAAHTPVPQRLKLGVPAHRPLGGVAHHQEHLAAAVLPYAKDGVVRLLGHLPVTAGGDERGIDVEHRVVVLQPAGEPLHDILAAGAGQPGHLLLAVRAPVDGLRDLACLLRGKPVGVKEAEQPGALLALAAYQPQQHRIEAAAAGDAQRELKAVAVPAPGRKPPALLTLVCIHEQLTLMEHQGVHD